MTGTELREDTDLKAFLGRYLRTWPILALAGVALLALVMLIVMAVQPQYAASTSIMVATPMRHDDPNRMVQPPGPLPRTDKNYYYNEQLRITSQPIIRRVVDRLGLQVKYVQEGTLLDWDVYRDSPIKVELDSASVHDLAHVPYGVAFYLHGVNGDEFTLVGDGKYGPDDRTIEVEQPAKFGEWITLDSMRVRITKVAGAKLPLEGDDAMRYGFIQQRPEQVVLDLMEDVLGEMTLAEATTVKVTYTAAPKAKALDVLQAIGEEYTADHLAQQRSELDRTIQMVEQEIEVNRGKLKNTGEQLERFKRGAGITNLAHSTILLQEALSNLDAQRESLIVQGDYFKNLLATLESGESAKLPSPKAYGVSDPLLNDMTTEYATLQSDIAVMREEGKTANPTFSRMLRLLGQQRDNIRNTVESFKRNNRISLENVEMQRNDVLAKQDSVPKLDRLLADREREQRTYEAVNTDLMARLSNLHVQRAALAPEVTVITPAYLTDTDPVFPNAVILLAAAFLLALLAPLAYLICKALFSNRITGAGDLAKALPGVPLGARVPWSTHKDPAAFIANTDSPAHIEMAKLAALLEIGRSHPTELNLVCGAGGREDAATFAERLAWMLAHRGNQVVYAAQGQAAYRNGAPRTLTLADPAGTGLDTFKNRMREGGAAFVIMGIGNADSLASTPQIGSADRAIVVCQPGVTRKPALDMLALSRANGQLPPLLLALDGLTDERLPWFGLGKGPGEKRLGPMDFIRYNWRRATN